MGSTVIRYWSIDYMLAVLFNFKSVCTTEYCMLYVHCTSVYGTRQKECNKLGVAALEKMT